MLRFLRRVDVRTGAAKVEALNRMTLSSCEECCDQFGLSAQLEGTLHYTRAFSLQAENAYQHEKSRAQ